MAKTKSKRELPPLEYRSVFVQFIKRQKCRFNPSFQRYLNLPNSVSSDVFERWRKKHPRVELSLDVSMPPVPKAKRR